MEYTATIEIRGSHPSDYENRFYHAEETVISDTIGGVFDALVEKAYDLYFALNLWLIKNRPADYDMQDDHWYVNCSFPSVMNPYSSESFHGAGSSISDPGSMVQTVAHYRHMEIQHFMESELKYMKNGYYKKYVDGVKPLHSFFDVFHTDNVAEFRNYGYNGQQLNQVLLDMGEDHVKFLKEYARYRSLISRGKPEKIVIPEELPNGQARKKSIWELWRR